MRIHCITALMVSLLCAVSIGRGQDQQDATKQLARATSYYSSAQFDKAVDVLSALVKNTRLDKATQKEVFFGLGRAYVAKGQKDKAKQALTKLLALEPPMVELDPDAESPLMMKAYYDARKVVTGNTVVEKGDPGMKTIAILDFKNRSLDDRAKYDPMEKGFAELLIGQLHGATDLKVIERERIQWILDEIGLENNPGKFDVTSAVRVGKQLGVHSVLLGSFIKVKDELWIGARLVKVETSEIILTDEVKGDADEFFDLAQTLSAKVIKGINATMGEAVAAKKADTKSLDAMLSYSEGLVQLERGNYKAAYERFMVALKHDPAYERARVRAESIKPYAG